MKICTGCGLKKTNASFWRTKKSPDGLRSKCIECTKAENKAWYEKQVATDSEVLKSTRESSRRSRLKLNFGITLEQYQELYEKQKGCCAVCGRHQDNFVRRLAVDHNHDTREIRALLCDHCNRHVVGRHKDGKLLRAAANYLDQPEYTGWFVPSKKRRRKKRK